MGAPCFYNTEMESKYRKLYRMGKKLKKMNKETKEYKDALFHFEYRYHAISKTNAKLVEASKGTMFPYLEPTSLKNKVEQIAVELGIKLYKDLDKKEKDFIIMER